MKAPSFWQDRNSITAKALEPLGLLYALAGYIRRKLVKPFKVSVPVICVGNLTAGGTGKTPVCLSLAEYFKSQNVNIHFITRGYGGNLSDVKVDTGKHSSIDVGDEALLLAEVAPTWVNSDRVKSAKKAVENGAEILIMDDGFQNPSLFKDFSFIVVDGGFGIGNRKIIPAGPLREPFKSALSRADAMIITGRDATNAHRIARQDMPVINASFEPTEEALQLIGQNIVAFAGIGRPEKFFEMLENMGCNVMAKHPFSDHYPYSPADIQPILDEAYNLNAIPVTTAKDSVRLPPAQRQQVNVARIKIKWENKELLKKTLKKITP